MIWAKVSFQFEGIHRWDDAKGEVEFLKNPHRHMFYVVVWVEQKHNDRDVEYIALKRFLSDKMSGIKDLGTRSCEQIAEEIINILGSKFGGRFKVEVSEDGENGCLIE